MKLKSCLLRHDTALDGGRESYLRRGEVGGLRFGVLGFGLAFTAHIPMKRTESLVQAGFTAGRSDS